MKKLILIVSLCLLLCPSFIFAAGTIELVSPLSQFGGMVGSQLSIPVNFIYSGDNATGLGVSVLGSDPSQDAVLNSSIVTGSNGHYMVNLIGTPQESGNFYLTLLITDNDGALLKQYFNLVIIPNSQTLPNGDTNANPILSNTKVNQVLPDRTAVVNQLFSQNIPVMYGDTFYVNFSAWQGNTIASDIEIKNGKTSINYQQAMLNLIPRKVGQYTIKADVVQSGDVTSTVIYTEVFNLIVSNPTVATPVNPAVIVPTPVITQAPAIAQPPVVTQEATKQTPKPLTTTATVQDTQKQQPTTPPVQTQAQPQPKTQTKSNNIFSNVWNFVKNIFKLRISITTSN